MKKNIINFVLKIIGRKRLIFWIAKDANTREVQSFNQTANTFSFVQDKNLQLSVLSNLIKSKSEFSKQYLSHYLKNGNDYLSQLGQDCLVDTIFKAKTEGFFIEIGVGNGKELSNTYFFEKNRDWNGLLCEPAKQFNEAIKSQRTVTLINKAVYTESNKVFEFSESIDGEFSSISEHLSENISNNQNTVKYNVETISFNDLCAQYTNGEPIDYLSVDTEGSEYEILSAIDFEKYDIGCISVEHNYEEIKRSKINALLVKNNFVEIVSDVFMWDSIYVNKRIVKEFL